MKRQYSEGQTGCLSATRRERDRSSRKGTSVDARCFFGPEDRGVEMDNLPIISEVTEVAPDSPSSPDLKEIKANEADRNRPDSPLHYADCEDTTTGHCRMCRRNSSSRHSPSALEGDDSKHDSSSTRYDSASLSSSCLGGDDLSITMEEDLVVVAEGTLTGEGPVESSASSASLPLNHFVTMRRDQSSNLLLRPEQQQSSSLPRSDGHHKRFSIGLTAALDPGKPPTAAVTSSRSMETLCGVK